MRHGRRSDLKRWATGWVETKAPLASGSPRRSRAGNAKGDKKRSLIETNRDHYWTMRYNDGIAAIQTAQSAYPTSPRSRRRREGTLRRGKTSYETACLLTQAKFLRPAIRRRCATSRHFTRSWATSTTAEAVSATRSSESPGDTNLASALTTVRATRRTACSKTNKLDEAILLHRAREGTRTASTSRYGPRQRVLRAPALGRMPREGGTRKLGR